MSLIIKGMDMPKHCRNCKFSYFTHGISMKCLFISEACKIKGRLSNCPLVAVPTPHGRLLDDFKLLRALINAFPNQSMNFYDTLERVIDEAPTIINAEVE